MCRFLLQLRLSSLCASMAAMLALRDDSTARGALADTGRLWARLGCPAHIFSPPVPIAGWLAAIGKGISRMLLWAAELGQAAGLHGTHLPLQVLRSAQGLLHLLFQGQQGARATISAPD